MVCSGENKGRTELKGKVLCDRLRVERKKPSKHHPTGSAERLEREGKGRVKGGKKLVRINREKEN